ncbi:uncharacterized protein LOC129361571 [Poeciliopsis prolifica]|uniref:uncharacterized protein LOC129361571 n=1 Tax=Poeciliopsis prolifica TaxID=188132 RepID=UPI0024135616|nr:uncharacterized protein LOC129361571 [Poeciliopsis prolifica]
MDAIFNLLQQYRLESYYNQFLQMGVKDEQDFLDGVTDEDLYSLGLSHVEKNRFNNMKTFIQELSASQRRVQTVTPLKTSKSFSLWYTYPKCPERKLIKDMDPGQNTVEDLMLRIFYLEKVANTHTGVCLFTVDGMPLTDDPFFNTWSLKERHIQNGDTVYAIFTPKENLTQAPEMPKQKPCEMNGTEVIRCHIMLKGYFEVCVDLESDTMVTLRQKLSKTSGIPGHVLHHKRKYSIDDTLKKCGISEGSTVFFSLSSFSEETPNGDKFYFNDVVPSVSQTLKGISVFFSSLYAIAEHRDIPRKILLAYIRKLTGCNPLVQSLHQLCRNERVTRNQKIAVVESLYMLFRELLPKQGSQRGEKTVEDQDVFENSLYCWAHLINKAKNQTTEHEDFAPINLVSEDGNHFCEPVRVPGVPTVFERADVLDKIKGGIKIPNCTEEPLRECSLQRAADVEKILLSIPRSVRSYPLWIHHDKVSGHNFQVNADWTFGSMVEGLKAFTCLNVTPPLQLKDLGSTQCSLVMLSEDNLGVYLYKCKGSPDMINVHDCLDGKVKLMDLNILAARIGDHRDDETFVTTRTPKEAILVLMDTSSSMEEECYENAKIKKINAVKELFDNFATRSMAYDFHHVIGLVKFDSFVKTLHTFTENLEKFKEHLRDLEASGCTLLYDALRRGARELEKVKERFPDCRLRIICLTDGNDSGSQIDPVAVTVKLLKSDITVDSILLGNVENNMLHGISNATGGCCFKPQTTKDGLKLFEIETVLSLEQRKPKKKLAASSISKSGLMGLFAAHGYDEYPETFLPSQINGRVTLTESTLKKKICESKDGRFMEKEKRILEELRSLHCDPHPFFRVFPSESDVTFWRILMQGPPDTPYQSGVFELYCQFGPDYPVKPPVLRFVTNVYHCNVNSVGRICHNIFDRNYNAHITMKKIFDAVYGLLIIPEPEDPLDSILAEEFLTNREMYEQEAKRHTKEHAGKSLDDMEKKLVDSVPQFVPQHLLCPLTKKMFVDPVKTVYGTVYERKAIEEHLKQHKYDPLAGPGNELEMSDLMSDWNMKKMVMDYRSQQIQ